jgi:pSer/pThr/pTyr-binding forkhead associated (FHA) protein
MATFHVLVQQLGQPKRQVELVDNMIVGRESGVELQIRGDDLISRRHAQFRLIQDDVQMRVLGTTNVTTLNDDPIAPGRWVPIPIDAEIRIGRTLLVVTAGSGLDTTHPHAGPPRRNLKSTVLVPHLDLEAAAANCNAWLLLKGTSNRRRRSGPLLKSETTIGSGPSSTFQLVHESVAAQHARVRFDGARWEVTDLGGPVGTRVDGYRVGPQGVELRRNSLLHFGNVPAVFVCHDPSTAEQDAREEELAVKALQLRQRLTDREIESILHRTLGGSGAYYASVLMQETEIEPEEWGDAVRRARQRPGLWGRLCGLFGRRSTS